MFGVRRPSSRAIERYLADQAARELSYGEQGATRGGRHALPGSVGARYVVDHHETRLGSGRALFARARDALFAWRHFEIEWTRLVGARNPAETGQTVATLTRAAGLWALNPCRVVYTLGAEQESDVAGFAYGTLPGHAEIGEERFCVEYEAASDSVRFEVLAFSRPGHPFARVANPYVRRIQKRFALASLAAMAQAVA